MKRICGIIDSTLREGEQAPGVIFSNAARRSIIGSLHRIGVDEIELGIAAAANRRLPRLVAEARTITGDCRTLALWCRCLEEDISFAASCSPDLLSLSIPASDLHIEQRLARNRDWVQKRLAASIRLALRANIPRVSVGLEDASRAEPDFLLCLAKIAEDSGACRVRLADTVGICTPASITELVRPLQKRLHIDIGVHCHNDFGMATANSITALQAGAGWLDATILGLGERAGNCRLEEVIGYLALQSNSKKYRPELLAGLCRHVARAGNTRVAGNHPIVGENIFTCETGLHQHGLSVNPLIYEPYDPGRVGGSRKIRFGHKTGKRAVYMELARQGISLNESQAGHLAAAVRNSGAVLSGEQLGRFADTSIG